MNPSSPTPPTYAHHHTRTPPHPNELPPSYDDATHSPSAPLLVGPPPTYGTDQQAYPEPDQSSISSELEDTTRTLPEWVGQGLVVLCFLGILYGLYKLVNDPDFLAG
ncbi:hypothetical protein K432DRAFT_399589 [Lepidopterella palustris CBS 459.81]|uniref:Uncharacterized protein n=1 Tax=Lepidopterella palustris CBS 459.81 TaxID=1314670 RepID=A0A8E2ELA0_9PEZI|nr:hypothetical protein K432DRAFT_399589 [Lepidopterella palustris CBS 459.81]